MEERHGAMRRYGRIGCAVCGELIGPDDEAIELLSTVEQPDPAPLGEPTPIQARPAYAHADCGVPARDIEIRRDLLVRLRP
jgi:hypothetical protein